MRLKPHCVNLTRAGIANHLFHAHLLGMSTTSQSHDESHVCGLQEPALTAYPSKVYEPKLWALCQQSQEYGLRAAFKIQAPGSTA